MRWWLSICLILSLILSGCSLGASDVVSDLKKELKNVKAYSAEGILTIKTSSQPQEISVQVFYLQPHLYRVELNNKQKNIQQVILKNEDGVFVISPHLKKSFRFQSDWPENSGQVYLYQTVLQSIIADEKRNYEEEENGYRFEVAVKTPLNQNWNRQRVVLDKKYQPQLVEVLNENQEVVVTMKFTKFEKEKKLDKKMFDTERNIPKEEPKPTIGTPHDLKTVTPSYIPTGTKLIDSQSIQTPEGPMVLMRYKGKNSFTLIQRLPKAMETHLPLESQPITLHQSIAVFTDIRENKKLTWHQDGVEFELVGNLPLEEMVKIANSTVSQPMK